MTQNPILEDDVVRIALRDEIGRSAQSRYQHRLHAVLLIVNGRTCREVADLMHENMRTIQRWVARFRNRGVAGLRDGERRGRPSVLSASEWDQLRRDVECAPAEFGFGREHWDPASLRTHLRERYDAAFSVRHCQRILGAFAGKSR